MRVNCDNCKGKRQNAYKPCEIKKTCAFCGNLFKTTDNKRKYCNDQCKWHRRKCLECDNFTTAKNGICRQCAKKYNDIKKEKLEQEHRLKKKERELKKSNILKCRKCGVPIQNRGNYYDYCSTCLPKVLTKINYCKCCGKVFKVNGHQQMCPDCQATSDKRRHDKGVNKYTTFKNNFKKKGCIVCGYKKCLAALEFHHIGQKKDLIINNCHSIKRLKQEIEKNQLVILCANCHRELHNGVINEDILIKYKINVKGKI